MQSLGYDTEILGESRIYCFAHQLVKRAEAGELMREGPPSRRYKLRYDAKPAVHSGHAAGDYVFAPAVGVCKKITDRKESAIPEALNPGISGVKRSRCRSRQEVNGSPTPFSALNYCLPALPMASMSLSYPNMAAYATMNPSTTAAATIYHTTAMALIWQ